MCSYTLNNVILTENFNSYSMLPLGNDEIFDDAVNPAYHFYSFYQFF